MSRSLLALKRFRVPAAVVGAEALLGGSGTPWPQEDEGFALQFTADDGRGRVSVRDLSTPANNLYNAYIDSFLSSAGDPKLVIQEDGTYAWSPHNLLLQSEDVSTSWNNENSTDTVNAAIAPDGTLTADLITSDSVGGLGAVGIAQTITTVAGSLVTWSRYVKAGTKDWCRMLISNLGSLTLQGWFDLTNGVAGTLSAQASASGIEDARLTWPNAPEGWWRVWIAAQVDAADTTGFVTTRMADEDNDSSIERDGTGTLYVWGAQLNYGLVPTRYVPTTTVVRSSVAFEYYSGKWRARMDPAGTNTIRNNTMQGAVAGTPGTAPTNWNMGEWNQNGLSSQIVGFGYVGRLRYMDVRITGTSSASSGRYLSFEGNDVVAAAVGNKWVNSVFLALVAGSKTNANFHVGLTEYPAGSVLLTNITSAINSAFTRYSHPDTLVQGTTTHVRPQIRLAVTSGLAVDFTIRIAAPQLETGLIPTSPVPTFGAARTRVVDAWLRDGGMPAGAEMTTYLDVTTLAADVGATGQMLFSFNDGNAAPTHRIGVYSFNEILRSHCANTSSQADMATTPAHTAAGQRLQLTTGWKQDNFAQSLDGNAVSLNGPDNSGNMADHTTLDQLEFGRYGTNSTPILRPWYVNQLLLVTRRVADADIPTYRYAA